MTTIKCLIVMLIVGGSGVLSCIDAQVSVDSLFAHVVSEIDSTSLETRLDVLKTFVQENGDYAPAYHEMAKLYMAQGTPQSRMNAKRALQEAIRLDARNVAYQITQGDLLWAQGFRSNAEAQFQKIYNTYPDNAKAAYMIGLQAVKQFYRYENMGQAFKHLSHEDLERAIAHLTRSIEINPQFQEPYYLLGTLYDDQKRPEELVKLSNRLLKHRPNDKDALLFKGLGLQKQGLFEESNEAYRAALTQMTGEERKLMESIDLIVDQDKQKQFSYDEQDKRERFWREQDPLFLTDFNERRLAHYGRIAYANLHFSKPSKGIEGWQTDMGKTYIRFGPPIRKQTIRPDPVVPETAAGFMILYTHREHWFYEGFQLTFQNWDGIDGWHFRTVDVARRFGEAPTTDRLASEIFRKTPSRYIDPYRLAKYSVPYQLVSFKEHDSVRVELSYVLPKHKLLASAEPDIVDMEDGTFLFDSQWQQVYRNVKESHLDLRKLAQQKDVDSLRQNHLISMRQFKVKPGDYHVVVEARSQNTNTIGSVRESRQFAFDENTLSVSDLLLARQIESLIPFPEGRKDLRIVPNPMRTFYRRDPVYIYLEVYNLKRDEFGQTRYEITYQLTPPEQKKIDPTLFLAMDYASKQGVVEIAAQQRGLGIDDQERSDSIPKVGSTEGEQSREQPENTESERDQAIDQIIEGESQKSADVRYQVKYVLPKSRLSEEFSKLAKNGIDMTRSISAEYEGRSEDDFTFLQIDVTQVPVGIHQLIVTIRDLQTQQSVIRKTLFRLIE